MNIENTVGLDIEDAGAPDFRGPGVTFEPQESSDSDSFTMNNDMEVTNNLREISPRPITPSPPAFPPETLPFINMPSTHMNSSQPRPWGFNYLPLPPTNLISPQPGPSRIRNTLPITPRPQNYFDLPEPSLSLDSNILDSHIHSTPHLPRSNYRETTHENVPPQRPTEPNINRNGVVITNLGRNPLTERRYNVVCISINFLTPNQYFFNV